MLIEYFDVDRCILVISNQIIISNYNMCLVSSNIKVPCMDVGFKCLFN
ncbi:hypothetical protein [Candidatus Hodgkinia cicadicola]